MNLQQALLVIAEGIWKNGNKIGSCLVPSDIDKYPNNFNKASDILIEQFNYTHFDRKWQQKGKTVNLKLYKAEALGAVDLNNNTFSEDFIVNF